MTAGEWDAWSSWIAIRLLAGSLQGAAVVGAVWLVCRRYQGGTSPSGRARAWWIVSLGLLLSLTAPRLPIPLLPAPEPLTTAALLDAPDPWREPAAWPSNASVSPQPEGHTGWVDVAIAVWMLVVLVHAWRLTSAYAWLRRAVRRSSPLIGDGQVDADAIARALGLQRTPRIHLSHDIPAPLVAGMLRPVVLIPASVIAGLSQRDLKMVIGHELAHVRRRDLLFAWVPALAERLFFFHPLARFAAREYAVQREAACDALVLDVMEAAPHEYGRMLVRLGLAGTDPLFAAGGSSPSMSALKRRLEMLHDTTSNPSSRVRVALAAAAALLAVLPLSVVARTPASPQAVAAPASPGTAAAPARPVTRARPATPVTPAVPGTVPRMVAPVGPEDARLERTLAEQQRNIEEVQEALKKLQADTARRQEELARAAAALQASDEIRKLVEYVERQKRMAGTATLSERQTTVEYLETQLRAMTEERDELKLGLQRLTEQIDALRAQLARERAGQSQGR